MPGPQFLTVYATARKACKSLVPPCAFLIVKNRGETDVQITNDASNDLFLVKPTDPFLYLVSFTAQISQICYQNVGEVESKNRVDIAVSR